MFMQKLRSLLKELQCFKIFNNKSTGLYLHLKDTFTPRKVWPNIDIQETFHHRKPLLRQRQSISYEIVKLIVRSKNAMYLKNACIIFKWRSAVVRRE